MKRTALAIQTALLIVIGCGIASTARATAVTAASIDYGISAVQSDAFNLDFTGNPDWIAGSQRSSNGDIDPNNQRSGRLFVDFQLDSAIIAAANAPGALVYLTFNVDSIGQGVTGTPYTDGLDMRYYGVNATDRDAATLWDTVGVGTEQSNLLPTTGPVGSMTVLVTNASVLSQIQSASAGQFVAIGLINSAGTLGNTYPVGTSVAETYGFRMNHTLTNYALTIVPEPAGGLLMLCGFAALCRCRRKFL